MMDAKDLRKEIVRIAHLFYARGWSFATSGNYSARIGPEHVLITASGKDKGLLNEDEILTVDLNGQIQDPSNESPSAETELHCALYSSHGEIGAILHTHSVSSTVISSLPDARVPLSIGGYEMLKAFQGVSTHLHTEQIPVFANDQDMSALAARVLKYLEMNSGLHGFLIAGHGLYCWGRTISEALRHAEAFEFLFECVLNSRK
jgi:methylthioribulose-1-phosphate dehydratase